MCFSKRESSHFDIGCDPSTNRKKAKLYHERSEVSHSDRAVVDRDGVNSRLTALEHLTREVLSSPGVAQYRTTGAGLEILKAAADLDDAFRRAKDTSPSISEAGFDLVNGQSKSASAQAQNSDRPSPALPRISDRSLEEAVFTHPGVSNDFKKTYDRLEILGDAYVELIATKLIWRKFPDIPSGRMSQIRETLVKNETLSEYATMYGFQHRASVPRDYLDQPKRWTKTKGDIFEAYVAAVILSDSVNGYDTVEEWLSQLWMPKLTDLGYVNVNLQAKEALAKRVMGKGVKLRYVDERAPVQLKGGTQTFFIGLYLTGWGWTDRHLGSGKGPNKAIAGDQAAREALLNTSLIDEVTAAKKEWYARRK